MMYYLLKKSRGMYVVKEGYSTLAQLCRDSMDKNPLVIKGSFYPGDKIHPEEIKDLLIVVDTTKYTPFVGTRNEHIHILFDTIY